MDDQKQVDLATTDHHQAPPSLWSEEKREIIKRDDGWTVALPSPQEEEEEEARDGINKRVEQIVAPDWMSRREKRRIEEMARRVVQDPEGCLTEKVLLRLLRLTRNQVRWGFLSPDSPLHPYYLQLKDMERCRMLRSE